MYFVTLRPGIGFEDSITTSSIHGSILGYRNFTLNEDWAVQLALFGSTSAKYPVLPGIGLTWRFSENGLLLLTPPRPGVRYTFNQNWNLFLGGSVHGGSFRVAEKNGVPKNTRLNYTEFRTGAELTRSLGDSLKIKSGLGWMIKRKFDHDRIGIVHRTRGAPYATLSIETSF